ncbi:MAG: hypothetical protein ACT4TC_14605, partial [Myxococcaceae bacterium]
PKPEGTVLPELRLNARYAVSDGFDLGVSFLGSGVKGVSPSYRLGLYVDGKKELVKRTLSEDRVQVLSFAPGLGYQAQEFPGTVAGVAELTVVVPLLYGHQTEGFEWVGGAGVVERLTFDNLSPDKGARRLTAGTELLLLVGWVARGKIRPGVQLTYQMPLLAPAAGMITLSAGLLFDLLPQTSEATPAPEPHP